MATTSRAIASSSSSHLSQSITANSIIGNNYSIGKILGEGSFGVVYEGMYALFTDSSASRNPRHLSFHLHTHPLLHPSPRLIFLIRICSVSRLCHLKPLIAFCSCFCPLVACLVGSVANRARISSPNAPFRTHRYQTLQ